MGKATPMAGESSVLYTNLTSRVQVGMEGGGDRGNISPVLAASDAVAAGRGRGWKYPTNLRGGGLEIRVAPSDVSGS